LSGNETYNYKYLIKAIVQLNEDSVTYRNKTKAVQELIKHALYILESFGVPLDNYSSRRLERMAVAFLAVADIKTFEDISKAKDQKNSGNRALKTRDIINYVNEHFGEEISSGSYDDIRRKDLKLLVLGDIVLKSSPESATNDSTRGYVLNPFYADILRSYGKEGWDKMVFETLKNIQSIGDKLAAKREIKKIPIKLAHSKVLEFSPGEHNELQKAIIEEFLPRFGYGAEVLYVGDTAEKYLYMDEKKLTEIQFFELSHDQLPDVIALSESKNWLFLIEAVHSSGPIDQARLIHLENLTKECTVDIIYVTAFLTKKKFRSYAKDVAWETEVWIAENPDHLIHFNGDKFLGPYKQE